MQEVTKGEFGLRHAHDVSQGLKARSAILDMFGTEEHAFVHGRFR